MSDTLCGIGVCNRSKSLQKYANLKSYSSVMGIVILVITAVYSYMYSVQSTTQTVFSFSATDVGIWFAMFEAGSVVANVFGSYFLSKKHIPRILGLGIMLMVIGCFVHGLPNFTISYEDKIKPKGSGAHLIAESLCRETPIINNHTHTTTLAPDDGSSSSSRIVLAMYCMAGFVMGVGYAPLWSLGIVYIDNNVEDEHSATAYIAVLLATYTIGPVVGYGAGALFLNFYATLGATYLTPDDAEWIGAWWIGYLAFGSLLAFFVLPLCMFPKRIASTKSIGLVRRPSTVNLVTDSDDTQSDQMKDDSSNEQQAAGVKDFLPTLGRLFINPLWLLETLCACGCSQFISGCIGFLNKYYDDQFHVSASRADLLSGIPGPFLSVFSIFAGGYLAYKKKYTLQQDARLVFTTCLLSTLILAPTLFMRCTLYPVQPAPKNYSTCVASCNCEPNLYDPVCYEGVAYRSPCLVGCTGYVNNSKPLRYTGCFCSENVTMTSGRCSQEGCLSPYFFTLCTALSMAVLTFSSSAGISLIMKSVTDGEKSLALGVQSSVNSLLAFIPAPILFGAVIDSACRIWEHPNGTPEDPHFLGYCMEYDGDEYRFRFLLLSVGMLLLATVLAGFAWCVSYRPRYIKKDFELSNEVDKQHSLKTI